MLGGPNDVLFRITVRDLTASPFRDRLVGRVAPGRAFPPRRERRPASERTGPRRLQPEPLRQPGQSGYGQQAAPRGRDGCCVQRICSQIHHHSPNTPKDSGKQLGVNCCSFLTYPSQPLVFPTRVQVYSQCPAASHLGRPAARHCGMVDIPFSTGCDPCSAPVHAGPPVYPGVTRPVRVRMPADGSWATAHERRLTAARGRPRQARPAATLWPGHVPQRLAVGIHQRHPRPVPGEVIPRAQSPSA